MQLAQVDISKEWQLSGADGKEGFHDLGSIVTSFLPKALLAGGVVFFILVIVAGFSILSGAGSGDEKALQKWQQILSYGVIGLIIMFGAFWILQIINFITKGSLNGLFGKPI